MDSLYLDKNDMPMVALHWETYLEHIITEIQQDLPYRGIAESYPSCM